MISVRVGCEHLEVRPIGVDAIPAFARDLVQDAGRLQGVERLDGRRLADAEQPDRQREGHHRVRRQQLEEQDGGDRGLGVRGHFRAAGGGHCVEPLRAGNRVIGGLGHAIEEGVRPAFPVALGGRFAMAMPRGSGKSSIAETACIWVMLTGAREIVCLSAHAGLIMPSHGCYVGASGVPFSELGTLHPPGPGRPPAAPTGVPPLRAAGDDLRVTGLIISGSDPGAGAAPHTGLPAAGDRGVIA